MPSWVYGLIGAAIVLIVVSICSRISAVLGQNGPKPMESESQGEKKTPWWKSLRTQSILVGLTMILLIIFIFPGQAKKLCVGVDGEWLGEGWRGGKLIVLAIFGCIFIISRLSDPERWIRGAKKFGWALLITLLLIFVIGPGLAEQLGWSREHRDDSGQPGEVRPVPSTIYLGTFPLRPDQWTTVVDPAGNPVIPKYDDWFKVSPGNNIGGRISDRDEDKFTFGPKEEMLKEGTWISYIHLTDSNPNRCPLQLRSAGTPKKVSVWQMEGR